MATANLLAVAAAATAAIVEVISVTAATRRRALAVKGCGEVERGSSAAAVYFF
jgi:hypothetical protein